MRKLRSTEELLELRDEIQRKATEAVTISVCGGTGCRAFGAERVLSALERELERRRLSGDLRVKMTGCHGFCERGPIVVVRPQGYFYPGLKPEDVPRLVDAVAREKVLEEFLYVDPVPGQRIAREEEVPFYRGQRRIVLGANGHIDPTSIRDYLAIGGYSALAKALAMDPEEVIQEVKRAGLRGRGGAGFPTGKKWEFCRKAKGPKKYVICNADEGDPGAYMDRSVLEGNPHAVIEGMLIGAYAIGADEGYVYVRAEYPLAVRHLRIAIRQAEELGLLDEDILGTGFSLRLHVFEGAGAFVCGEETALLASIEGQAEAAPTPAPLPGPAGPGGPAHQHQQRGDLGQCAPHHPEWRRLIPLLRHRDLPWDQDLLPHRQGPEHGARGGPYGDHPPGANLRHRRRASGGEAVQGGPDRGAFGGVPAGGPPGPPHRLRVPHPGRGVDGVGGDGSGG